ncbi:mtDNA inheritance, partitioning of the mitochondrial organelle [Dinochytrium kinnereticum]|nr:mtDNA inheritance, partitioning of the mitochondrial organelle [Dinochytrium kinnereticum]
MAARREIVTLQIGHLSSYVGTHFWNIQDSYDAAAPIDNSVLFCESTNAKGENIYFPRVVVLDLKGNFGSLKVDYESEEPSISELKQYWNEGHQAFHEEAPKKNEYLQHLDSFESNPMREALMDDNLRFFLEEADCLQGFQVLADTSNGFSGLAAEILDALRDDFGKLDSFVFGIGNEPSTLNNPYNWTGFLASAFETISLPSRIKSVDQIQLYDILHPFASTRLSNIATLGISPQLQGKNIFGHVSKDDKKKVNWIFDLTLNLAYDMNESTSGKTHVLRGILGENRERNNATKIQESLMEFGSLSSTPINSTKSFYMELGLPQPEAFPDLFGTAAGQTSTLFTQLKASPRIAGLAASAARTMASIPQSHASRLAAGGPGALMLEEIVDIRETLLEIESVYYEMA